jgi:hypothetical protein
MEHKMVAPAKGHQKSRKPEKGIRKKIPELNSTLKKKKKKKSRDSTWHEKVTKQPSNDNVVRKSNGIPAELHHWSRREKAGTQNNVKKRDRFA